MIITIINIILGAGIGWLIPWFDRIAYIYILHPEAQVSQYLKYELDKKQWRSAWQSLKLRGKEFDKLTTRTVLFRLAWVVLAFFTLTSSASWFGKTLVLMLGLRLLLEEWLEYFKDRGALKQKLFWQVKREWGNNELKVYLMAMTLVTALLVKLTI